MNQGVHSTHSIARRLPWAGGRLSPEPLTLSHGKRNIGTQLRNRSKLVKRMTPARNKGGMHVNGYLHKCLHHKIHPGKQHCKGTHTKRNIHISALPHADTPTPARAKLVWSQGPAETQEPGIVSTLVKEVGDNGRLRKMKLGFGGGPESGRGGNAVLGSGLSRGVQMQRGFAYVLSGPRRYEDQGLHSAKPPAPSQKNKSSA